MFYLGRIGKIGGVGQIYDFAICFVYLIYNTGSGSYKIKVILPLQPLLDYLQMKQS